MSVCKYVFVCALCVCERQRQRQRENERQTLRQSGTQRVRMQAQACLVMNVMARGHLTGFGCLLHPCVPEPNPAYQV